MTTGKTKCQLMELIFGRNGPKCKEDGQFEEKQCSAYGGYCWCVDKEGNEIQGSKKMSAYIQCTSHAGNVLFNMPFNKRFSSWVQL